MTRHPAANIRRTAGVGAAGEVLSKSTVQASDDLLISFPELKTAVTLTLRFYAKTSPEIVGARPKAATIPAFSLLAAAAVARVFSRRDLFGPAVWRRLSAENSSIGEHVVIVRKIVHQDDGGLSL